MSKMLSSGMQSDGYRDGGILYRSCLGVQMGTQVYPDLVGMNCSGF